MGRLSGEIEQMSYVADAQWPKMLQVNHRQTIRARRWRAFTGFDGVDDVGLRERSKRTVQRVIDPKIFIDSP